ncbi:hypothetical protein [Microbacterium proteolyticum]|uniref:hypothetical protein n=1 Tax=Microbacterium proteolyticum TaxID=1572644 RepID=UPI0035BF5B21
MTNVIDGKIAPLQPEDAVTVTVPPHPAGFVPITAIRGNGDEATAPQGFEFLDPLGWLPRMIGPVSLIAATVLALWWLLVRAVRRHRALRTALPPAAR